MVEAMYRDEGYVTARVRLESNQPLRMASCTHAYESGEVETHGNLRGIDASMIANSCRS